MGAVKEADRPWRGVIKAVKRVFTDEEWNLVVFCQAFETGGEIDCITDHRPVHAPGSAHRAQNDDAGIDADADLDRTIAGTLTAGVVFLELFQHRQTAAQCGVGRVGKQGHDRITDVFVDDAAMRRYDRFHLHQVGVQEIEVFLRTHGFRQRGKVADVGKQYCHLAFDLLAEFHLADVVDAKQMQEFTRYEPAIGRLGIRQLLTQGI